MVDLVAKPCEVWFVLIDGSLRSNQVVFGLWIELNKLLFTSHLSSFVFGCRIFCTAVYHFGCTWSVQYLFERLKCNIYLAFGFVPWPTYDRKVLLCVIQYNRTCSYLFYCFGKLHFLRLPYHFSHRFPNLSVIKYGWFFSFFPLSSTSRIVFFDGVGNRMWLFTVCWFY